MNIEKSKELYSKAIRLMPGGVNSPVRAFRSVGGEPLFMKQGRGSRLVDVDDNEYIDYCMSWGPLILGHADSDVIKAITGAAANGTSFGTPNPFEVTIAGMVAKRFPSIEKIRFVNSGTEAVMSAIRLARGFTGKNRIIKFDGCYHGHADHLLVAAGSGLATFGTPDSAGVTPGNAADTLIVPFNDLEAVAETVEKNGDTIAAVILEPLPCNYSMIPPADGFLRGVRELCDRKGILLIFDEVITGFRLAPGGAQEYYGVAADLTTLGKIIGGGLPVGAYGGRADIMSMIAPDGPVYQAGTLSGNPLAMAAGITTLEKLDRTGAYMKLKKLSDEFAGILAPVLKKHEGRFLLQRLESVFAFYFTGRKEVSSLAQVKECDMKLFGRFHAGMLSRGIYLSPSGYEVGFLSTAHSSADLEKTAAAIDESLRAVLA
ncbi:MAG TPA: glutamate-1-semialdehyde 2,1-aminomutase [Spirochaetota bacterium]|nr:glutamate-1-semialdehyde 2,1-aminomutase [Spirochaetota bacterium]